MQASPGEGHGGAPSDLRDLDGGEGEGAHSCADDQSGGVEEDDAGGGDSSISRSGITSWW